MAIKLEPMQRMEGTRLIYISDVSMNPIRVCSFKCDCGKLIEKPLAWVRHMNTTSCGCFRVELVSKKNFKHGDAKVHKLTGAYRSWKAMNQRVKVNPNYKKISICDRWLGESGFINFHNDMGERPLGTTIDRSDNSKGYCPENCRWATKSQQANNTRVTHFVEYEGVLYPQSVLMKKFGISYSIVKQRRRRGLSDIASIITPIGMEKSIKGKAS